MDEPRKTGALATFRNTAKLLQADAAEKLGVTPDGLDNIERGAEPASVQLLADMASLYGVSPLAIARAYRSGREAWFTKERNR